MFDSVQDFLVAQSKGRPRTFEEIVLSVNKSRGSCFRELNGLLARFEVVKVSVWFNGRECPFYTVRKDVQITKLQTSFTFGRLTQFLKP